MRCMAREAQFLWVSDTHCPVATKGVIIFGAAKGDDIGQAAIWYDTCIGTHRILLTLVTLFKLREHHSEVKKREK